MIIHDEFGKAITIPSPVNGEDSVIYYSNLIYWGISRKNFFECNLDQVEGLAMRWTYEHKFQ